MARLSSRASMNSLQRVTENLLLVTATSRALLHTVRADGGFEIQAEAVQHGQRQIRHHPDMRTLFAPTADLFQRNQNIIVENDLAEAPSSGSNLQANSSRVTARMFAPVMQQGRLA